VGHFVLVSTDKAAAPISIMGASKRAAEQYIQSLGGSRPTRFVAVRFGNVLGSNGSVIPLFHEQIAHGGPVTVTDRRATRFLMTIPEASGLILHAARIAQGGETYVLDMGDPVRVIDLAHNLIRLYGYEPGRDIEIRYIGLRPGERLHERLVDEGESTEPTGHPKILRVASSRPAPGMAAAVASLEGAVAASDRLAALALIQTLVPTYAPLHVALADARG
jgi:FlaA1/EpsC-like NDP-sugar epimerase